MDNPTASDLMDKIFNNIYNALVPSSLDDSEPPMRLLSLMLPGTTVGDSFDLSKPDGRKSLYEYVNRIPNISKQFSDSGRKVTFEYQKILGAVTPEDGHDELLKQKYEEAKKLVWDDSKNEFTEKYKQYEAKKEAYSVAHQKFLRENNSASPNMDSLQKLKDEEKDALTNWVVSGKAEIEQAIETMNRYRAFNPSTIFSNAIADYEMAETAFGYPCDFVPSTWFADPEELSWETIQVTQSQSSDHVHKDVSSISSSFSTKFSAGLWGGEASGDYKKNLESVQNNSKIESFGLSLEVARVDILRDWYNGGLLQYPNVYVEGVKKHGICVGSLKDTENINPSFSVLPTALILARNINVYNNFSETESKFLSQSSDFGVKAKVSYGPFSLSNDTSYSDSMTDDEKKAFGASAKITVGKRMQIIGIICSVQSPGFPEMNPPASGIPLENFLVVAHPSRMPSQPSPSEKAVTMILNKHQNVKINKALEE